MRSEKRTRCLGDGLTRAKEHPGGREGAGRRRISWYRSQPPGTTRTRIDAGSIYYLFNTKQHIGLLDRVSYFRLSTRTIVLDPLLRFLYWHMSDSIEYHMYAAAPRCRFRTTLPAPAILSERPA